MLTITTTQCKSACADTVHDLNTCENDVKCLCTKSNGKQLVKCVDCFVKISGLDPSVTIGQLTLDSKLLKFIRPTDADVSYLDFVTGCKNAGKDVGTLTLGSSSSALHLVANGAATAAALAVMVAYLL